MRGGSREQDQRMTLAPYREVHLERQLRDEAHGQGEVGVALADSRRQRYGFLLVPLRDDGQGLHSGGWF